MADFGVLGGGTNASSHETTVAVFIPVSQVGVVIGKGDDTRHQQAKRCQNRYFGDGKRRMEFAVGTPPWRADLLERWRG
jgi:hypothetical protein